MSEHHSLNLSHLIQERKDEKRGVLKQRLRQKLELIRERSSLGGNIKPFPAGTFEKLKRKNVWRNVLDYITKPLDISNSYFSCGLFSKILAEKQKLLRLPETLRVLEKNVPSSTTKAICLNLRGTSKDWKKLSEAHLFESTFSGESWYLNMDKENDQVKPATPIPRMCIFDTEKSVDLAMASLSTEDSSFNSSLIRKVYVDESKVPVRDLQRFHEKVLQFLGNHGESVWLLQFSRHQSQRHRPAEIYSRLWEMLLLVPHLKALILQSVTTTLCNLEEHSTAALQNLHERLNERPFPVLPSLQHLHCVYDEEDVFLTQIFQNCVNLKSVILSSVQCAPEEMIAALSKLTLERYDGYWENNVGGVHRLPLILANRASWPLKKLTMDLEGDYNAVSASELFPALNKFQDTLQHLSLEVSDLGIKIDTDLRLELPKLKYLCMDSIGLVGSRRGMWLGFDHLLSLKSLENVVILEEVWDNVNPHVKVERYLKGGNMVKSNVWECFPNLLTIEHNGKIYKRPRQI